MRGGRHTKVTQRHWAAALVAVSVALAAVAALGLLDENTDPGRDPDLATASESPSRSAAADPVDAALDACRGAWRGQAPALRSAGRSLGQWRVHVDAMNDLVAGRITLAQATDFWRRTRQGASSRVARFDRAEATYAGVARQCLTTGRATRPNDDRQLKECLHGVRARDRAIGSADRAITTWTHHIHDMESLLAGQLTPDQATRMWLRNWRAGVDELDDYDTAVRRAHRAGSC